MTSKDDEDKLLRSTALQNANSILIARQRAEQRKEFYLAEGQRLAHMGSWAFNPSGVFEYWSPELFQIYGLDPAKGAPTLNEYLATVHPQDRELIARTIENMLLARSGCDVKQRILRPDGELRHIRCVGVPVFDEGVFKGFVGTAMDVTEQDQLTQELRRREAYLAEAQRLSHTGSFGWSVLSGETVWSDETFRIFEYDRAAKPNLELVLQRVHPEDKVLVQQLLDRASQDGKDFDLDYRLLMPSGSIKHLHVVAHAVRDEAGNIEFIGAVMDVTERKRIEDRERSRSLILESLTAGETLATILDSIARAIEVEDPTALCTILLLDKEGKHLLHGAAPSMPRFFIDAVDGIEIGEAIGSCGAAAYTKQRVVAEDLSIHPYWLRYRDLTQRAELRACWSEPILAANGHVLGTFGIYHRTPRSPDANDVKRIKYASELARLTIEYKQAEAEKARLVTAIEQSVEAVVITNASGAIEYVNPAFTGITGYSRAEVQGQNPRILKSDKQDPAFYQQLWATILKGEVWRGELINRRKDGRLYAEQLNIAPVRGERGEITHFIATKQDVTERKHLEEQFRQAQKMEAVGRLAGGVAHDFNNLLTVINGYSDLAVDYLDSNGPVRGYLKQIMKAGDQAASLTRQLLAFSRQQVLAPRVLDLNALVADMEKMLQRLIGEDVDLAIVRDSALGRAKADPGQIEQILMNLAVNARDAMPEGGKLVIETTNVELDDAYTRSHALVSPGRYVMLAVSDTGIGMDAETQAHMFEPFFTTKEKDKGTGLGLATVYGIVKQSGGHIWVYSEPGRGTAFKIYLPRVEEVDDSVQTAEARGHSVTGTETILLVEDEAAVRSLAARVLQDLGYKVLQSTSPEDALQIGERHEEPIDLLLTDVVMPRMSGRKVAEHLALLRPGMKVVCMSGYTDDAIVRHGVLAAGIAFLQKPFTPAALARKVREVLDAGRQESS